MYALEIVRCEVLLLSTSVRMGRKFASDLRNANRDPIDISVSVSGSITVTFAQICKGETIQSLGDNRLPFLETVSRLLILESRFYSRNR